MPLDSMQNSAKRVGQKSTEWSEEDDAALLRLHQQGVSTWRLSVKMRRTERAVSWRLQVLRKRQTNMTQDENRGS